MGDRAVPYCKRFEFFFCSVNHSDPKSFPYQQVMPVDPDGKLYVVGGRIFKSDTDAEKDAIDDVKRGTAFLINDVSHADTDPSEPQP
jgi:hypothetical protein